MADCPMYLTTGVCRRGKHCTQNHNRPTISPTLLFSKMYQRLDKSTPGIDAEGNPIDPNQIQEHFEDFYKDIFKKLSKYGEIRCLHVCDNLAYHMAGNVYVQFCDEKQAKAAFKGLQGMLDNNGRPIRVHYSPVTNFYQATCGLFEKHRCERGFKCDLLHVKKIRHTLMRKLYSRYNQSRSRSPSFRRDRERSHERGDLRDRDRVRHEMRYERMSRRSRYRRSRSRSRSPSYRRYSRERSHERGVQRSSIERDRDRERHERRS
ncbi:splicing factor U2af small subunit A-like [Carex rostrata]